MSTPPYLVCLLVLLLSRGLDILSTWITSPTLLLEANIIARKLGWSGILLLNAVIALWLANYTVPTIALTTVSCLVAMRNRQSAWLVHSLGEQQYNQLYIQQIQVISTFRYLSYLLFQIAIPAICGAAVIGLFADNWLLQGIGTGLICYAIAVGIHSLKDFIQSRTRKQ